MSLREWCRDAIENGGPLRWLIGLAIKLTFEGGSAVIFGYATALLFTVLFSDDTLVAYVNGHTFDVIWFAATVLLFLRFTRDQFTESLE